MRCMKGRHMKAYFFRYLNQNTKRGTVHTVSVNGVKGAFCLYYLCSDGEPVRTEELEDERFFVSKETISVLILENLHPLDLEKVRRLLRENQVEKVFLPYGDPAAALPELGLAGEVQVLLEGQEVCFQKKGWNVWLKCFDNGEKGTLVLYHGPSKAEKEGKDCLLTVKPFDRYLPCTVGMEEEDHTCAMRCCLYNDFTLCKGHNGKNVKGYVTGALLLGNVDLTKHETELKEDLAEFLPDIRLTALPAGGMEQKNTESFLDVLSKENTNFNQYYLLPEGMEQNEKILKAILKKGPRRIPVLTGDEMGLCVSGFFKDKE